MTEIFHIHDVLDMLHNASTPFTTSSLMQAVDKKFGKGAVFTSCSETHFGRNEIIAFLETRKKISVEGDRIHLLSHSCNH